MPALLPSQKVEFLRTDQAAVPEQTKITCLADDSAFEVTRVTFPAFAASAQGDYVYFESVAGNTYAFWLDKNNNGTAPVGAIFSVAVTQIEVDISTGQTAAQVAAAVVAAIGAQMSDITIVDNLNGTVDFTQNAAGSVTNATPHNNNDSGAGSMSVSVTTAGADSSYQSKYLQLQEGDGSTSRYVWLNIGGGGSDPSGTGSQLEVAVSAASSASQMASSLASAINADGGFSAVSSGADVYVWASVSGNALNASDVNTGFSVSVLAQGYDAEENLPGGNLAAASPTPISKVAAV